MTPLPTPRSGLLGLVVGVLWVLALPPVGLWPLGSVGAALLVAAAQHQPRSSSAVIGMVGGLVVYAVTLRWAIAFTGVGYVALVVLQAGFLAAAMAVTARGRGALVATPAAITLSEWLRHQWPLSGLPMSGLDLSQAHGPLLPLAAVGGPLLVTLATAMLGSFLWFAVNGRRRTSIAVGLLTIAASMTVLPGLVTSDPADPVGHIEVAIVQGGGQRGVPAVRSDDEGVFARHLTASRQIDRPMDLVLWPEDVVDVETLEDAPELDALASLARELTSVLVVGTISDATQEPGAEVGPTGVRRFRNRAQVIGADGSVGESYDKVIRVPFGEYVPWRGAIDRFVDLSLIPREAVPGAGPGTLSTDVGELGVAISFEGLYASRARSAVLDGALILLNPTNSSSFAISDVAAQQLAAARLRAVETGRVVLMASPTGRSAIVLPDGRVLRRSGLGEAAVLTARVPLLDAITPYTRWGDGPVLALASALFVAGSMFRLRDRNRSGPGQSSVPVPTDHDHGSTSA